MKFLMLVLTDPDLDLDTADEAPVSIEAWVDEVYGAGKATDGDRLQPAAKARTVRRRGGRVIVSDGPFAESYELIGGFDILECDSLEEAEQIAARHPMATRGVIQLHPHWPLEL